MSSTRRAYDILRGYVNNGWDKITGVEETDAERELREAMEQPYQPRGYAASAVGEERPQMVSSLSVESARKLLNVSADATTKQIRSAKEKIRADVDPKKFPEGSDAQARAKHLLFMIDGAERVLVENQDPTIRRFEGLQIE